MKDDQRVALTKRLLQEGLLRLLKEKDISKIKVSELCMESGINRATFYRHYQQPHDVIHDIRYKIFEDINELAKENYSIIEPQKLLEQMCQYFYDNSDLLNILFKCRTDEEFVTFIKELCQNEFKIPPQTGYEEGLDKDEFRLTTYCVSGGVYYILRQWITEPINKTPQEIAKIIYRFIKK